MSGATNETRLVATLDAAAETWSLEIRSAKENEDGWTALVCEPALRALGWPRLVRDYLCDTGAYFEWPGHRGVDVALLLEGSPWAFAELKRSASGSRKDLLRRLKERPRLRAAALALATWFEGGGGFELHDIAAGGLGSQLCRIGLKDGRDRGRELARLALPVARSEQTIDEWLSTSVGDASPIRPRWIHSEIRSSFLRELERALAVDVSLEPLVDTMSSMHVPLADHVEGIGGCDFNIDSTMERISVVFRDLSRRESGRPRYQGMSQGVDQGFLAEFVASEIKPLLE